MITVTMLIFALNNMGTEWSIGSPWMNHTPMPTMATQSGYLHQADVPTTQALALLETLQLNPIKWHTIYSFLMLQLLDCIRRSIRFLIFSTLPHFINLIRITKEFNERYPNNIWIFAEISEGNYRSNPSNTLVTIKVCNPIWCQGISSSSWFHVRMVSLDFNDHLVNFRLSNQDIMERRFSWNFLGI